MYTIDDYLAGQIPPGTALICPFHDDRRASAQIMADTGRFWCFACRWGGNRQEVARRLWFDDLPPAAGLAIADAYLEHLARRSAWPAAPRLTTERGRQHRAAVQQPGCLQLVQVFYQEAVEALKASPGLIRRLQKERGLIDPVGLGIGLAVPEVLDRTIRHAAERIASWEEEGPQLLCQAGITNQDGWFRLNNRWILPAFAPDRTLIAYQARSLAADHPRRYLNIPRWPRVPAGLDRLDRPGPVYLVEGWFDAAPLWESGLAALALGGLTLSATVLAHLRDREVIIILDADDRASAKPNVDRARAQMMTTLAGHASRVRCIIPPYKDVSLWAATDGQAALVISLMWDP